MTYTDRYVIVYRNGNKGKKNNLEDSNRILRWHRVLSGAADEHGPAYRIRIREKLVSDAKKSPACSWAEVKGR